jgi:DnaJ-domain-containing protein 1
MPYSCAVVDGRPILRRSREDEGYRVLGRREQRTFQACSPVNPDMCRQWTVYRFDLDCDGARVPWVSVVAAAGRREGAWIEEGRLHLDMGPRWGLSPDDPCARDDRLRNRRLNRYCADRSALGDSSSIVEMPPGFAPMLGIDGIFVAGGAPGADSPPWAASPIARPESPPASSAEPSAKGWRTDPPQLAAPEPAAKAARTESEPPSPASSALPDLAAKGARIASLPAAPPQPAKEPAKAVPGQEKESAARTRPEAVPESKPADAKAAPPSPSPQSAKEPAKAASGQEKESATRTRPQAVPESKPAEAKPAPPSPPVPAADPGTPLKPRIINRPAAAPAEAAPQPQPQVTAVPKAVSGPETGSNPKVAALPPLPSKEALAPSRPAEKAAAARDDGGSQTLMSAVRAPALGAGLALAVLAVLSLATFAVMRRRERARLAGAPSRDLAAVSLGAGPPPPSAPAAHSLSSQPDLVGPEPVEPLTMPSNWGDRIPRTREEALQVLGVAPDANLAAIKKVVDGLRASWHPDLASGGTDRRLRELRMQQINAAWEIIAGKRASA